MASQVFRRVRNLRWLVYLCGLALVLSLSPPVNPAVAAVVPVPGVVPGADPVDRPPPAGAVAGEGLPADQRAPVVPPGTAAGGQAQRLSEQQWAAVPRPGRARPLNGGATVFTDAMLRSGFALGDTSLVAYFNLADDAPAWSTWRVRLYDAASATEQASTTLSRADLDAATCTAQREYCRSFGAGDGWTLDPSVEYFVTVAAELDAGGEAVSAASDTAKPRTTIVPPPISDRLAAGCGCGNAFDMTTTAQASRAIDVNTGTGAFVRVEDDLTMASFGVPFGSTRTYSSANAGTGPFGPGWAWSYGLRVVESADGALVRAEDGAEALFREADDGYLRPAGVRSTLRRAGDGWTLVTVDQTRYQFDAQGRLVSVTTPRDVGVRLAYTDRAVTITDASGRSAVAKLDDGGLIREIKLPDRRSVRFSYVDGRLVGFRDARGFAWSYRYGPTGQLTEVVTPQHIVLLHNEYDDVGRVVRQRDALGKVTTFAWDAGRQEATTTDPDGVVVYDGYRGNVLVYTQRGNRDTDNHRYDASLNRTLVVNGRQLQYEATYDAAGNVTSQAAPRPMTFGSATKYDDRNNPIEYTDANGQVWRDTYNDFNELVRSEDAEHHTITYGYDDRGLLVTMTDQRGKVTHYENLPAGDRNAGLLHAVTSPAGRRTEYGYDATGRQTTVVDPRGTVAGARREDFTTRRSYDALDQVIEVRQPGKRGAWRTVYDAVGQTIMTIAPTGVKRRYEYYPTGQLKSVSNAAQRVVYTYTAAGRRAAQRVVMRHAPDLVTTYAYNAKGLLYQVTSPRGNVKGANPADFTTTYVYDAADNLVRTTRPYPGGKTVSRDVAVDELDRTTATVDELAGTSSNTRDNTGNVTSATDTLGRRSTMEYDANGRQTAIRDPGGNVTRTVYDEAGHKIRETSPTGGTATWTYDDDGLVVSATEARGNEPGADPERYTTHFAYDQAGNRVRTVDPLDHVTVTGYDANNRLVSATDANGHTVRYTYREDDLPSTIHAPNAYTDPRHPESGSTVYGYDEIGQLVAVTDPNGHRTTAAYDDAGRVVEETDALGRRGRYGYDADSNRTSTVTLAPHERLGGSKLAARTIVDSFDIAGRRDRRTVGSDGPVYTWGYDAKDRITSFGDPTGVRTVTYDDEDQIQRVVRTEAGGEVERFTYAYDARGNVTSRTYPDGTTVTAGYDAGSRITELTTAGGAAGATPATWHFGYDVADHRTSTTLPQPTGLVEQRGYDDAGRLTSIGTVRPDGAAPEGVQDPVSSYQLELDPVGNPTRVVTTRGGVSESVAYAYDQVDQLVSACYGATSCAQRPAPAGRIDYTYDLVGNRTAQHRSGSAGDDWTRYSYDAADELTRQVVRGKHGTTVTDYRYDLNGNQTRAGRDRMTYNLDNTLAEAIVDGQTTTFGYDATGLRLTATTGTGAQATTQRWSWDTNGTLPEIAVESVTDATGSATQRRDFAYGPDDEPLALLQPGSGAHSYTHDWLGGVADMVSPAGVPEAGYDYDPFGNPRTGPTLQPGTGDQSQAPANPLRFAGAYQDSSSGDGNYYLRARTYNPATGRFTSGDPTPPQGSATSVYAYANNNPTSFTDPTGTTAEPTEAAPSPEDVAKAQQLQSKSMLDVILEAGGQILMEFLGITDLINCLKGNLGSCVMLIVGSLPWGKIFKAKKIGEAIYRAGKAVVTFLKELDWAKAIIRGAERAAEAAKAAAALAARQAAQRAAAAKAAAEAAAKKAAERAAARARAVAAKAKAATKKASKKAEDAADDAPRCRNSFVAGTAVLLATGAARAIDEVQPGDTVLATDPVSGRTEPHQVVATIRTDDDKQYVDLTVIDGAERHTVTATDHHPFWSATRGRWVSAGELEPGELLRTAAGTYVQIGAVRRYQGRQPTYNLTVDELHTYYVLAGSQAVLVHNADPGLINIGVSGASCPLSSRNEYYDIATSGRTSDEINALQEYAKRTNAWLEANGPQTVVPTAGPLRRQANATARAERRRAAAAGSSYRGQAGHVPDTGITGQPTPPGGWLDMPGVSNNVAGGGLSSRIGTRIRGILIDGTYVM